MSMSRMCVEMVWPMLAKSGGKCFRILQTPHRRAVHLLTGNQVVTMAGRPPSVFVASSAHARSSDDTT